MKKHIVILIGLISLISCDKDETIISPPNDDKLLELAYDNTYQYPDGFYHEAKLSGFVYYENRISIKPIMERENVSIELNTNDKEQALTWSNLSNEYGSVERRLVKENETEKYFEFVRVSSLNDTLLSRVHRTDYFVSLYDKFTAIDTIGIYNDELSAGKVKELIEYLWGCGSLSIYEKVIESRITEKSDHFEQYIQSLQTVYGDFGVRDEIIIYDNNFVLDKSTKILTIHRKLVKEIEGKHR